MRRKFIGAAIGLGLVLFVACFDRGGGSGEAPPPPPQRWVTDRAIAREPGLLTYFYVDRIDEAVERATAHGGEIVQTPYAEGNLWVATVCDPAGNLIGLWQEGPR